jgi:FkbM family methyltransferase
MLFKKIKWFLSRPDVKRNLIKASFKRLFWRLYWVMKSQPFIVPLGEKLKISIPKTGSGASIYYYGFSEPETADFMLRFLRPGMVMLDVGAHIGEYTLMAAQTVGSSGQVHAFEPQSHIFPILSQNVELNDLSNVKLNCSAVSDRIGEVEFEILNEPAMSSIRKHELPDKNSKFVKVACVSLDSYSEKAMGTSNQQEAFKIDLIKVDVEGAEKFVFQGAENLLNLPATKAPTWIFEYSPVSYQDFDYQPNEILDLLEQHGYEVWQYCGSGQIKAFNSNSELPAIVNLVATKDKAYLLSLLEAKNCLSVVNKSVDQYV